ncbi:uncharacterized protein An05g00430 [Aspergillus niger]|uniref:Contig An05c0020, genomic contig n=2 Tax=Aspergillus niger TaxID=5061 RepID=A2QKJ4_ASPNC|nr:uncharacterized protein An05g00430 [Aspergillus niger]CAK39077.1 unnamed protein product [Aspergillus niger]
MSEFPPASLRPLIEEIFDLLRARKETISVAETASGGLISACLLSTPGASTIYKGGLTVYTLDSRIAYTGWTPQHWENYSGPTPEIVAGIAENVRGTLKSTYTVFMQWICGARSIDAVWDGDKGGGDRNRGKRKEHGAFCWGGIEVGEGFTCW